MAQRKAATARRRSTPSLRRWLKRKTRAMQMRREASWRLETWTTPFGVRLWAWEIVSLVIDMVDLGASGGRGCEKAGAERRLTLS